MTGLTREMIFERTNRVFRDVFDDPSIKVGENTKAADIEDWDSLMHINLVLAIEEEFGMKFSMGEVTGMKNVGEMADILLSRATK
jgi:acyl carrier protein